MIFKCKNDETLKKNSIGKVPASPPPLLLKTPAPAPYLHPLFQLFRLPPPREVIKIYSLHPLKKRCGGRDGVGGGGVRTMNILTQAPPLIYSVYYQGFRYFWALLLNLIKSKYSFFRKIFSTCIPLALPALITLKVLAHLSTLVAS